MKALKASSLVLVIVFLFGLSAVPVKAAAPTLADQLNMTLSTVDWSSPTSFIIPHFGLIFTREGNYDAALSTIPDFKTLIQMKRIAELDDVNSSLLNQRVIEAMDNQTMVAHWPNIDSNGMLVYWRFLVFMYRYAIELGGNTSKWNRDLAFQEYLNCWQADPDFLWFNPADGSSVDYMNRYYDENAEVLSIFLKFYQIGVPEALNYANQMWAHLCTHHWSGSYFPYTGSSGQVECEAGPFAEAIAELYATNGHSLPNFPDYILQDLDYKLISGGDWSAKLWSPKAYVVRHAELNPEKRLENTVTAWAAMHSYYALMNSSMKSSFINLLTGAPKAWQGLIDHSNMYSDGQFRWRENGGYSDDATCGGVMILFLNGIVPDTGSLAIPVIDEVYEDWYSMFPASHFRFDYESKTIRIPVWAGKINFTFGTEIASYNFPDDGIYEVQFSSDWNTVTNANRVSSLSERFLYLNQPDTTPPTVVIVSPENKEYSVTDVSLTFTLSEPTSWIGYSIDGGANVTIAGNTTLSRLPNGSHSIVVYARDLAGNIGSSNVIDFTVDTSPPNISLLSPQNQIYNTTNIPLTITVDETVAWIGYSVDGQTNVSILGSITLIGLADGTHSIVVYARDLAGNIGSSNVIDFTVDTSPPNISLLSPQNQIYNTTNIPLTITVDETVAWIGYSVDGQTNVSILGSITLIGLADGTHSIVVYARDLAGNIAPSATVYFTTDTISPSVSILSPQNTTYDTTDIPLTITINETTSWIGYSLDGQANMTINGNATLTTLSAGPHNLIVYAKDMAGNTGHSETLYFSIAEPFPTTWIIVVATAIVATGGGAFLFHFKRTKKAAKKTKQ
jgi:hypothetical protein